MKYENIKQDENEIISIGDIRYNDKMHVLLETEIKISEKFLEKSQIDYMIIELWMTDINDHISKLISTESVLFSLSKRKDGKPLTFELLKDYYKEFNSFSVADRIRLYKLREDRADVIVPALQIYINVMRWANTEEIYVPQIGLADGLIQHLYSELQSKPVLPEVNSAEIILP